MRHLQRSAGVVLVVAGILFAGGAVGGGGAHAGEARHWGPEELWRGVDVEQLPLEAEVTKTWEEDGCVCQKLTFVSEVAEGTKVRIFAMYGAPKGGKNLPGILHIHGGGQTASLAWVEYWAKRGYACATFDFCGKWENRRDTRIGGRGEDVRDAVQRGVRGASDAAEERLVSLGLGGAAGADAAGPRAGGGSRPVGDFRHQRGGRSAGW